MAKKKLTELPKLPRGMGSYSWKNDEHTRIRYRKQITKDGQTHNISVEGDSIAEVNALMKSKEDEILKNIKIADKDKKTQTLAQGMKKWLELYKVEDVQGRSYDRIESTFLCHIDGTSFGETQEQAITSDDIQHAINNLTNTKTKEPLGYSSKKKFYELLDQYFKYKYIYAPNLNPMLPVKKPTKTEEETLKSDEMIIWDDNEMKILCNIAMQPYIPGKSGFKNGCAIIFIMWTFVRIGEALALQWKDIDLVEGTLKISKSQSRRKIRKGAKAGQYEYVITPTKGKKTRQFKMCQMAIDAITEYKKRKKPNSEEDYVFANDGKIINMTSIERAYANMRKTAELNKNVTIHGLRHTGISYFLRHGVPVEVVSRMAGHQSIQITLDTYYQVIEEQKIKAIEDLNNYAKMDILPPKKP